MAVVDRRGCDGCGRTLPVEELTAVTLAGEQAVCCPECREHAESVETEAGRRRGTCSGCGETYPVEAFEAVELPDGSTVACCPDCIEHAESVSRRTSVDGHRGECSGCGDDFDVSEMDVVELDDGETVACCGECAEYARAAARTTEDETAYDRAAGRARGEDAANDDETPGDGASSADGDAASAGPHADEETALAAEASVCDQCGDWVDVELFEVVTVHDRVEEFCPPCKDRARREGVVTEVRMRRAEAYDVLGLYPGADDAAVRDAYLSRIKTVHPDQDDGSKAAFRRVQRAYERLTD